MFKDSIVQHIMLSPLLFAISFCLLAVASGYKFLVRRRWRQISSQPLPPVEKDPYLSIETLPNFDWKTTPPIRNSPLKPKYHLTMAVEKITLSEILDMDNTYAERMQIRRQIMDENTDATIRCNKVCEPAVLELHDWIFGTYLPQRYPTMYELQNTTSPSGPHLLNKVTNELIPLHQPSPLQALHTLGAHVDTDLLLLLPSSTAPDGSPLYHLEAFVCCFPSGFSLRKKLGLPLSAIHMPVPGYKTKLEKSMDRFFARLECGSAVKRANWTITTNEPLFSEGGNHLYATTGGMKGEEKEKVSLQARIEEEKAKVVIGDCRLRSERQTLFRLPRSRAVVFGFKTFQYLLEDVKREGYGERLAEAIEGLGLGNVPEIQVYKRGVVWGEKVLEFLRR
ncbi:uncharacterized protein MYCFIDRAFT_212687 [Pseudocercospora fijiensis CIRAD86]|uniref:Uncharacterized protein n=1 Tax=Pseudocercospora fijiensis (strain CIRAD86) TaxID=383855 RepID=M3AJJ0_PSEFD|nr:uncharacterized protein MYCFIDRAFT_212687 [Pseudocercospora fijiensis CIRAD86]EME77328.1 hypothetical protein MYCFIDRAFT_212687 [Pseudocercospora fijiensis CIRAD86]